MTIVTPLGQGGNELQEKFGKQVFADNLGNKNNYIKVGVRI